MIKHWAALSPIGLANCFSNPIVVNHYTGDILVPIDQITKKYTYTQRNEAFPNDFPISTGKDYPGILSNSLDEQADADEVIVQYYKLENQYIDMDMPTSDKLLTINIFDDGPMDPKGTHTAPGTSGSINTTKYHEEMFTKTLKNTEVIDNDKLILLAERYAGNSIQLPTHEGIDDTLYGSLNIYRQEIIDELNTFIDNNSFNVLDDAMRAIINSNDAHSLSQTRNEIKEKLNK